MAFLLERDAINGKDGKAFLVRNGRVEELFHLKKLNADATFQESDFKVVGTRVIQTKTSGVKYSGSMEIYYGTPTFLDILLEYQDNGVLPYFTLQVINDDKTSTVGKQTVSLLNCKFNKVPIAILDADSDQLSVQTGFSFTKVEVIRKFGRPANYG